jgi:hypothetical protein
MTAHLGLLSSRSTRSTKLCGAHPASQSKYLYTVLDWTRPLVKLNIHSGTLTAELKSKRLYSRSMPTYMYACQISMRAPGPELEIILQHDIEAQFTISYEHGQRHACRSAHIDLHNALSLRRLTLHSAPTH